MYSVSLFYFHAAVVGVRPLVLVGIAAGADERRGRPGALVVGLFAGRAVPPGVHRIGRGFAGLVADEVLLVLHVRPAGDLAAAATRPGLDGVLGGVAAGAVRAVIGAVGQARSAARSTAAARRVRGARGDNFIDGAVVEGVGRQIGGDVGPDLGVGGIGRRCRAVEAVGGAAGEVGRVDAVLEDGPPLPGGAELVAEGLQRRGIAGVGAAGAEARAPEEVDQVGVGDHAATMVGQVRLVQVRNL